MKTLLIIIDGLGDEPTPQLDGKTPLDKAFTPNLDWLAQNGVCGLIQPFIHNTAIPTSEDTHFALFGYNPEIYGIRRGLMTARGAGIKVRKGDIALRGNFATVDEELNIIDRRAGRIKNPKALIKALSGMKIDNVKFFLKTAGEHRVGIVMRGKNLSPNILDGDPYYGKLGMRARKIKPLDKSKTAIFTAQVLNEFLEKAHQILKTHSQNKKRKKLGFPAANYILVRGASTILKLPSFKEKYGLKSCCIAGKFLYQQIGKILGMDLVKVPGATGLPNTSLKGKFEAAKKALKNYDFVFLHIKATDSLAEDGNFSGKKEFIEKIDQNLKSILDLKETLIVITADHSTCSLKKRHCKRPCPILIYGNGKDSVKRFSEKACHKGSLGKIEQLNLMAQILK